MRIEEARSFLILGAQKAGTTSLARWVDQHRDVRMSDPKEPIFFEAQWERGLDWYRAHYFRDYAGEPVVGEARTHNLALPFVPVRVRESLPDARLVAIVRNPVDRAYSAWWHRYSRGQIVWSFEEELAEDRHRIESGVDFEGSAGAEAWSAGLLGDGAETRYGLCLELGHYARQLERYRALFPATQLHVVLFEDLAADPDSVVRGIWSLLGVDPSQPLESGEPANPASKRVQSTAARAVLRRLQRWPGRAAVLRRLPAPIVRRWKTFAEGRAAVRPPMDPATEASLLEHYAPHNRALEALLGRELPSWFRPDPERTAAR